MSNFLTTSNSNSSIAQILYEEMMFNDRRLKYSLRSQSSGYINIFFRKGDLQKIMYPEMQISKSSLHACNDEDDFEAWDGVEIPTLVYEMFCVLIRDAIESISPQSSPLKYGTLKINFEFSENNGEWEAQFNLVKEVEKHFRSER